MIEYREVTTRSTAAWKQPRQVWSLEKQNTRQPRGEMRMLKNAGILMPVTMTD
jgi:hypothetical protein